MSKWMEYFQAQLLNKTESENVSKPSPNPRPPGVIRPVSATRTALEFFMANPHRYFSRWILIKSTGCTEKSIDWACRYLVAQGLIQAAPCDQRNPRYNQYRLAERHKGKPVEAGVFFLKTETF